jgi:hypothetical protein
MSSPSYWDMQFFDTEMSVPDLVWTNCQKPSQYGSREHLPGTPASEPRPALIFYAMMKCLPIQASDAGQIEFYSNRILTGQESWSGLQREP